MRAFPHVLLGVVTILMLTVLFLVFGEPLLFGLSPYVETESTMGIVQRIFYFHVPSALTSFLAFFTAFIASAAYLTTRRSFWDHVAHSAVELGVLFCTAVLVTGPMWARPVWGHWWPWEPRLTTTLIMWLMYVGYLLLRSYSEHRAQRARFCAVLGVVAFLNVPLVYMSVRWWRGVHPIVFGPGGGGIAPRMSDAFNLAMVTFVLLFAFLLLHRVRLGILQEAIEDLQDDELSQVHY